MSSSLILSNIDSWRAQICYMTILKMLKFNHEKVILTQFHLPSGRNQTPREHWPINWCKATHCNITRRPAVGLLQQAVEIRTGKVQHPSWQAAICLGGGGGKPKQATFHSSTKMHSSFAATRKENVTHFN